MRRRLARKGSGPELTRGNGNSHGETRLARSFASSRPKSARLRHLIAGFCLTIFAVQPAFAGPWTQTRGSAYLRASSAFEDHDGFEANRSDIYGEWGVTDRWTVSGKFEAVDFDRSNAFDSEGWRFSARRSLWSRAGFVTSAEVAVLEGAALGGFRGCESRGLEAALGAGYGGKFSLADFYTGLTIARREHEDDCYHDRLEAVFGYTTDGKWFWTGQVWSERGETDRSDKIEIMTSRKIGEFEFGVGFRREVSGEFEESATVISLAYRPDFDLRWRPH